jgi:hypothetical protein
MGYIQKVNIGYNLHTVRKGGEIIGRHKRNQGKAQHHVEAFIMEDTERTEKSSG